MQVPKRRSEQHRVYQPVSTDAHLTAGAIEGLKRELRRLEGRERRKAAEEVARTKEMGDLSENAAYSDAKAQLRRINDRILSIKERLRRAIVIPAGAGGSGIVGIGSTVLLRVDGDEKSYEIVGSQETNPGRGRISHLSPLGQALLGRRAGDRVTRIVNGREVIYEIVQIT